MAANKVSELLGNGKGNQEVMPRKLAIKPAIEPLPGFMALADRAVPIAAGAVKHMGFVALVALIKAHAVGIGSAIDNCLDYFKMVFGHQVAKALNIF